MTEHMTDGAASSDLPADGMLVALCIVADEYWARWADVRLTDRQGWPNLLTTDGTDTGATAAILACALASAPGGYRRPAYLGGPNGDTPAAQAVLAALGAAIGMTGGPHTPEAQALCTAVQGACQAVTGAADAT